MIIVPPRGHLLSALAVQAIFDHCQEILVLQHKPWRNLFCGRALGLLSKAEITYVGEMTPKDIIDYRFNLTRDYAGFGIRSETVTPSGIDFRLADKGGYR